MTSALTAALAAEPARPTDAAYALACMSLVTWMAMAGVLVLAVALVVLFRAVSVLGQAIDNLTREVSQLRDQTLPALHEARRALKSVEGQAAKADALLDVATSLTATADNASKLAHRLVTNPVIKVFAFFAGTRRAASKLRENG